MQNVKMSKNQQTLLGVQIYTLVSDKKSTNIRQTSDLCFQLSMCKSVIITQCARRRSTITIQYCSFHLQPTINSVFPCQNLDKQVVHFYLQPFFFLLLLQNICGSFTSLKFLDLEIFNAENVIREFLLFGSG